MEVTEVRVKLTGGRPDKLRAYCSVTFDGMFIVRDIKIIDGPRGEFVAMPSRKVGERCPECGMKNHLGSKFCNECGGRLPAERKSSTTRRHADIAHPLHADARAAIQERILRAYREEVERSKVPGYQPSHVVDPDSEDSPAALP
jgi:stage V sporulation protein G